MDIDIDGNDGNDGNDGDDEIDPGPVPRSHDSPTRVRPCSWCAADVVQVCRPGRPRLYCHHACRQRAYEHRHGLEHRRTHRVLPGQLNDRTPRTDPDRAWMGRGSGYERGGWMVRFGRKIHALRPAVRSDGFRRETVCGLLVPTHMGSWFTQADGESCRSCQRIVAANPLTLPVEASNDLARLRALIDEAVEGRLEPAAALDWLWRNGRTDRPDRPDRPSATQSRNRQRRSGHRRRAVAAEPVP